MEPGFSYRFFENAGYSTKNAIPSHLFVIKSTTTFLCTIMGKKIKNRRLIIKVHIIGWCLLLIVPFISTRQVYRTLLTSLDAMSMVPVLVMSFVLISIFYFNYFVLIPKYLFRRRYRMYGGFLILSLAAVFFLSGTIFSFTGFNPHDLVRLNPIVKNVQPLIKLNGVLMLIISIVTSTLLAVNSRLSETEEERLSAQIASLKSQINPHFLFNTLNNIYATAIEASPRAADMVDKLAEMMRYTMRETQKDFVLLEDEVNYIENYIELQKIRLDRRVTLEYVFSGDYSTYQIAPMMLIPFIENAFKHGVNSEQKSHIKIKIDMKGTELHFEISNRKVDIQNDTSENSGLGISNTRHRLDLIYPSKHLLSISETEKEFKVSLHINLS